MQYAKGLVSLHDRDNVFVAGRYGGQVHVLRLTDEGRLDLYRYSADLVPGSEQNLLQKTEPFSTLQLLPFANFYYVFLQAHRSRSFRLLRVNEAGKSDDLTAALAAPGVRFGWRVQKLQNSLAFVTDVNDTGWLGTGLAILYTDSLLGVSGRRLIDFDFEKDERLDFLFLPDTSSAFLIKTFLPLTAGHGEIELSRYDFERNLRYDVSLASEEFSYSDPLVSYHQRDSTFLVLAGARKKRNNDTVAINRFYGLRLNGKLEDVQPPVLIQVAASENERLAFAVDNFPLLLPGSGSPAPGMFGRFYSRPPSAAVGSPVQSSPFSGAFSLPNPAAWLNNQGMTPGNLSADIYRVDARLRIISLAGDRLNSNLVLDRKKVGYRPEFFNCFVTGISGKQLLLFGSRFSLKRGGIASLPLSGSFVGTDVLLPVKERVDYLLPLAKWMDGHLLVPYLQRRKLGILRLSVSRLEE